MIYDYIWQDVVGNLMISLDGDYKVYRIMFRAVPSSQREPDVNAFFIQSLTIRNYLSKKYGKPDETTKEFNKRKDSWYFGEYTIEYEQYYDDEQKIYKIVLSKRM